MARLGPTLRLQNPTKKSCWSLFALFPKAMRHINFVLCTHNGVWRGRHKIMCLFLSLVQIRRPFCSYQEFWSCNDSCLYGEWMPRFCLQLEFSCLQWSFFAYSCAWELFYLQLELFYLQFKLSCLQLGVKWWKPFCVLSELDITI